MYGNTCGKFQQMIKVQILQPNQFDAYRELVSRIGTTMFYHQTNFIEFAAVLLSADVEIFGLYIEGRLVAACPWLVKNGSLGKVYNSLAYYGANGGIISINPEYRKALEQQMMPEISSKAASQAYVSNLLSGNTLKLNDFIVHNRMAQVTTLPAESQEESLMEIFHFKTRNMIRKGLKENITFQKTIDPTFLHQTHVDNMNAVGVAPKADMFFKIIDNYFENGTNYEIFEALIDGDKAAAVMVFYHNNTVEYYMPAINITHRNKQPLSALIFHVMKLCIEKGFKLWNWGGTPISNENLYRFKNRFGAQDYPYTIQISIYNKEILNHTSQEITSAYPGMFVAPFDMLKA